MKIKYLGTAAYEGFPGLFCECEACKRAEELGGKNMRTRASMLINEDTLVDFSQDLYLHKLKYKLNLAEIKYYLITHSHSDHFNPSDLMARADGCYTHLSEEKKGSIIKLYGNHEVKKCLDFAIDVEFKGKQKFVEYTLVEPFKTYEVDKLKVTPLLAQHQVDEQSLIYLIEQEGKTLLYGNDTGTFPEETFDYLKGVKLDIVSLDCTNGARYPGGVGHMGLETNVQTKKRLISQGSAKETTRFISTHFSHNCGMLHEALEKEGKPFGFEIAYDGLEITF